MLWRRSYDTPPPPIDDDDEFSQVDDPRYATLPDEIRPRTECLADVVDRMLPVLVRRDRARPADRADRAASPRTATRCGRWSSTSTTCPTRPWSGSTSRPASRCSTSSTPTCGRPTTGGELPRSRRCGRRDRGRQEPGTLSQPRSIRRPSLRGTYAAPGARRVCLSGRPRIRHGRDTPAAGSFRRQGARASRGRRRGCGSTHRADPPLPLLADRRGEAELEDGVERLVGVRQHRAEQPVDLLGRDRGQRQPPVEVDVAEVVDARRRRRTAGGFGSSSQR